MSEKVKRYRAMYVKKLLTAEQIEKLVDKGLITREEFYEICFDINK